ncbi:glycosyltransferase 28 [Leucogyrophana mollusca]|uniref:Glycosyltransferase 28 n=1 Tax=Leucogyrophana mollusca TaxID=85980 RepID=A0ACB8BG78_9AGAM|nr:glycosyltransferase 28 [Leucogyrophana mollusca]
MLVFVTVGSFEFDALAQAVLSEPVLRRLRDKGYTSLVLQRGNSDIGSVESPQDSFSIEREGVDIEIWKYKPSTQADIERADLVISHAGSGSILDVLRLGKPLIAIPNPTLLDNHQEELASALEELGHLKATSVRDLPETIAKFDPSSLVPFPPFDGSKFRRLVDEEMGFL